MTQDRFFAELAAVPLPFTSLRPDLRDRLLAVIESSHDITIVDVRVPRLCPGIKADSTLPLE